MDIVKAIYDMMGKYTYPVLREDTPRQHVDVFFQVRVHTPERVRARRHRRASPHRASWETDKNRKRIALQE